MMLSQAVLSQKLSHHDGGVVMFSVDRIIQSPHVLIGNFPCEFVKRRFHLRMIFQHFSAHDRYRFVGRKIMMVIFQDKKVERRNQASTIISETITNVNITAVMGD